MTNVHPLVHVHDPLSTGMLLVTTTIATISTCALAVIAGVPSGSWPSLVSSIMPLNSLTMEPRSSLPSSCHSGVSGWNNILIVLKDVLQFTHFLSADFVSMNDCVWASVQYMYMLWTMLSCVQLCCFWSSGSASSSTSSLTGTCSAMKRLQWANQLLCFDNFQIVWLCIFEDRFLKPFLADSVICTKCAIDCSLLSHV